MTYKIGLHEHTKKALKHKITVLLLTAFTSTF